MEQHQQPNGNISQFIIQEQQQSLLQLQTSTNSLTNSSQEQQQRKPQTNVQPYIPQTDSKGEHEQIQSFTNSEIDWSGQISNKKQQNELSLVCTEKSQNIKGVMIQSQANSDELGSIVAQSMSQRSPSHIKVVRLYKNQVAAKLILQSIRCLRVNHYKQIMLDEDPIVDLGWDLHIEIRPKTVRTPRRIDSILDILYRNPVPPKVTDPTISKVEQVMMGISKTLLFYRLNFLENLAQVIYKYKEQPQSLLLLIQTNHANNLLKCCQSHSIAEREHFFEEIFQLFIPKTGDQNDYMHDKVVSQAKQGFSKYKFFLDLCICIALAFCLRFEPQQYYKSYCKQFPFHLQLSLLILDNTLLIPSSSYLQYLIELSETRQDFTYQILLKAALCESQTMGIGQTIYSLFSLSSKITELSNKPDFSECQAKQFMLKYIFAIPSQDDQHFMFKNESLLSRIAKRYFIQAVLSSYCTNTKNNQLKESTSLSLSSKSSSYSQFDHDLDTISFVKTVSHIKFYSQGSRYKAQFRSLFFQNYQYLLVYLQNARKGCNKLGHIAVHDLSKNQYKTSELTFELRFDDALKMTSLKVPASQEKQFKLQFYRSNPSYIFVLIQHIALAIAELQQVHVFHRDINLRNILLSLNQQSIQFKLSDFDIAFYINPSPSLITSLTQFFSQILHLIWEKWFFFCSERDERFQQQFMQHCLGLDSQQLLTSDWWKEMKSLKYRGKDLAKQSYLQFRQILWEYAKLYHRNSFVAMSMQLILSGLSGSQKERMEVLVRSLYDQPLQTGKYIDYISFSQKVRQLRIEFEISDQYPQKDSCQQDCQI